TSAQRGSQAAAALGTGFAYTNPRPPGSGPPRGAAAMPVNHYHPKLHKKRVLSHADYTVYSVNGFAVRNVAQPDEEFGNFATRDEFPNLIPKAEIWISEKLAPKEGVFFIANALTQQARQAAGASDKAYDDGRGV